jgi:hypothetical protein
MRRKKMYAITNKTMGTLRLNSKGVILSPGEVLVLQKNEITREIGDLQSYKRVSIEELKEEPKGESNKEEVKLEKPKGGK